MSHDMKRSAAVAIMLLVFVFGSAAAGSDAREVIYVASNTIAAVDIAAGEVLKEVPLNHFVTDIVFSGDGERAFVATSAGLFVMDTEKHEILSHVTDLPVKTLELAPDNTVLYVMDHPMVTGEDGTTKGGPYQIRRVELPAGKVTGTHVLGDGYYDFHLSGDGRTIFALHNPTNSIDVYDTGSWSKSRRISIEAEDLISKSAAAGARGELYIPEYGTRGILWILDTVDNRIRRIELEEEIPLRGIAFSPDLNRLYILTLGRLISVDVVRGSVVRRVSTDAPYQGISCSRDGKKIYLTNPIYRSGGSVTVMDGETLSVEKVIDVPMISPVSIAVSP